MRQRDRDGKDGVLKEGGGNVLTDARGVTERWTEYFEESTNEGKLKRTKE